MPRRFPQEPVRDLLGILRSMFAEERAKPNPSPVRLKKIERIARELQRASDMAAQHDPTTAPYERACSMADDAVLKLDGVVAITDALEPVVVAAGQRVRGAREKPAASVGKWAVGKRS